MLKVSRSVPAPADMGVAEVIGVPLGAAIQLGARLEAVMEGVLVTGVAQMPLAGECVRCLEPLERELTVRFQELYVYPDAEADEDALRLKDDLFDLEPVLRDATVLALPLSPLCREDCPGLCPECGALLAEDPDHGHESTDPRWAKLTSIFDGPSAEADDDGAPRADENQEK